MYPLFFFSLHHHQLFFLEFFQIVLWLAPHQTLLLHFLQLTTPLPPSSLRLVGFRVPYDLLL